MKKLIAIISTENKSDDAVIDEVFKAYTNYDKKMEEALNKGKKSEKEKV